jgi:hypothetical protein
MFQMSVLCDFECLIGPNINLVKVTYIIADQTKLLKPKHTQSEIILLL